jgi:hypothetical protein
MKNKLIALFLILLVPSVVICIFFTGCGKNEAAGSAFGAAGGGIIGHAVAGDHNKAAGTLIGGLLGGLVGSSIGHAADDSDELENNIKEQRQREYECLRAENNHLREHLVKWCSCCGRRCNLVGAHSCAVCGAVLIREKICLECKTIYHPESGYKYCPYCDNHVLLSNR